MIKIKVTQEHINKGERGSCSGCPIALAAREILPKATVGFSLLFVEGPSFNEIDHLRDRYVLPTEAQYFINRFDNEWAVEPFEFELDETQMLKGEVVND